MKKLLTLPELIRATGGKLYMPLPGLNQSGGNLPDNHLIANYPDISTLTSENPTYSKVVYDSRQVVPGTLFVALSGENTDGHNYIEAAIAAGASTLLVRKNWLATQENLPAVPVVAVEDTLKSFQQLAADWRAQYSTLNVVGITGSVGKTSTKELAVAVLNQRYHVFKSPKSYNNEYSLMPVLLELQEEYQQAVIEMGCGWEFGELTRVCAVAKPHIGVELGVSHSHVGRMGSLENLAKNKAELVQSLPPDGWAVLNGDDPLVKAMASQTQAQVFYYGFDPSFDLWASDIQTNGLEGIAFTANYKGLKYHLRLPLPGRHNVYTALAASAIGLLCGLNWDEIEQGLKDTSAQIRVLVKPGLNGSVIIDDCYNASAVSTVAALDLLADTKTQGRKIAMLGDMLELGYYTEEAHRIVGRRAAQVVDILVVTGESSRFTAEEALKSGLRQEQVIFTETKREATQILRDLLQQNDYLLVKASRGIALEEVIAGLLEGQP
ncbi:MAG: UDP-N-acetylmuramoyl-tripeptide--D-alanyl-D-alanine ligase [Chloroflexi bacterium]|uniref:UDP-N-acetylmuramoyl-tripeptide--D-alanyl-D-alanine ligase n=1 Tax=Candidatus Chlorohelix allophototropha TaxID=3003348 RepID=A0A8T7M1C3_9CHLR|nr:UDP-N-acetylmuramoyl-tripeptide--D-alanyl-D-alanine ligase [Chloroflexota bacterium]WJW66369.1 UDP-N-acetylmuramoyl-tripeptide--D-alanyl-D-alanine ligase [Chloroflexota bacterium L227-S17]